MVNLIVVKYLTLIIVILIFAPATYVLILAIALLAQAAQAVVRLLFALVKSLLVQIIMSFLTNQQHQDVYKDVIPLLIAKITNLNAVYLVMNFIAVTIVKKYVPRAQLTH